MFAAFNPELRSDTCLVKMTRVNKVWKLHHTYSTTFNARGLASLFNDGCRVHFVFTFAFNKHLNFAEFQLRILHRVRYLDVFPLFRAVADVVYQSALAFKCFHVWQAQRFPRVFWVVLFGGADGDADVLFPFRDVSV